MNSDKTISSDDEPARTRAESFSALRPLLISIAYRMTGSIADAEDIVSDAYLRLIAAEDAGVEIRSLQHYLAQTVTRLSIDHLRLARHQRERYVGPWLPEPVVDERPDPALERVELADTISMAFLTLLETLSPTERAVLLLREVFDYEYADVAQIVGKSVANCRQILRRARLQIDARRPRFDVDLRQRDELADRFVAAVDDGDVEQLLELLGVDVVAYADGGGTGPTVQVPVHGRDDVAHLLATVAARLRQYGMRLVRSTVNGQPGARCVDPEGRLLSILSLDVVDGAVQTVRLITNPVKLTHLRPLIGPEHPLRGGPAGEWPPDQLG